MREVYAAHILSALKETDHVLDVGGWAQPFNRANVVLDMMPYESRGRFGYQGGSREYFTERTWIQLDICSRMPFPFRDKEFDFVVCSHTLEDIRDPVSVRHELMRIGKRGYVETPSRLYGMCLGVESRHYAGYWHHRWLVERDADGLLFTAKFPFIDHEWRYHLPSRFGRALPEEDRFLCFMWDTAFVARENAFAFDAAGFHRNYEEFVHLRLRYAVASPG